MTSASQRLGIEELLLRGLQLCDPRSVKLLDEEHVVIRDVLGQLLNGWRSLGPLTHGKERITDMGRIGGEKHAFQVGPSPQLDADVVLLLLAFSSSWPTTSARSDRGQRQCRGSRHQG